MTEKRFTQQEVNNILEEVLQEYIQHFINDKMTFSEFVIIENLVIKIQMGFKELEK